MSKTNAQRQADFRARHLQDADGKGERLNMLVDMRAKRSLERLASCYGVTQRAMLERLLAESEQATIDRIAAIPNGANDFYDKRLRLDT